MSKKDIKRDERAEEDRVKSAKKSQDKADKAERVASDSRFQDILTGAARSIGCCEPCNYHCKTDSGEFRPCKLGHEDSGPGKQVCADCSESYYRPKK